MLRGFNQIGFWDFSPLPWALKVPLFNAKTIQLILTLSPFQLWQKDTYHNPINPNYPITDHYPSVILLLEGKVKEKEKKGALRQEYQQVLGKKSYSQSCGTILACCSVHSGPCNRRSGSTQIKVVVG